MVVVPLCTALNGWLPEWQFVCDLRKLVFVSLSATLEIPLLGSDPALSLDVVCCSCEDFPSSTTVIMTYAGESLMSIFMAG